MNEIRTFEFESHALTFTRRADGEWWANGDEAAEALGYDDKRQIGRLFRRHADEFLSSETCVVTLTPQVGQAREARLYSPKGLEHLAMLGRTEMCKRFRRWVLDVIEQLRHGDRIISADRLAALEKAIAALVEERKADRELIRQLGAISVASIGHAGKMLSTFARSPEAKAYRDARIREDRDRTTLATRNRVLPLLDGGNGGDRHANPGEQAGWAGA